MSDKRRSVRELLAEAKKLKTVDPYVTSEELGQVIDTLHKTGMTWKEINAWCAERGYKWSVGGMTNGWRRWQSRQKKR